MAKQVRALVLAGNGINCEIETAHACRMAGADRVDIVYLWDLASGKVTLEEYDLLCLPGGFLDGDDLGSARASSIRIHHTKVGNRQLFVQFTNFVEAGGLAIGICNGFQLMVKLGLLPALNDDLGQQQVTLTWNDSGRFEDRWVELKIDPESPCVFTRSMDRIIDDLAPQSGEQVLPKTRYSGFYGTDLENVLASYGPEEVEVVGVCTSICVMDTVGGLANRDYHTTVPEAGVADFDADAHRFALQRMQRLYGATIQ